MGTGVGEAMLIGAAVGATAGGAGAAIQGGDPLQGALVGGAMGGVGGGLGAGFGAAGGAGAGGAGGTAAGSTTSLVPGAMAGTGAGIGAGTSAVLPGSVGLGATGATNLGVGAMTAGGTGASLGATVPSAVSSGISGASGSALPAGFGGAAPATNVFGQVLGQPGVLSNTALGITAGTSALAGATQAERDQFGIPSSGYKGPLNKFRYDPDEFTPSSPTFAPGSVYRPTYAAEGGIMNLAAGGMVDPRLGMAARQQADEQPQGLETLMARGGTADLGSYSDGGRMLKGPGDGMSDNIPATIAGKQPARLADGEFVVPADVVSHLGNGSTDAGAKQLYAMMNRVRKARTGNPKQGKQIKPAKYMAA